MSQHSTSPRPESRRSPSNTSITPNRIPDLSLGNISTPTFPSSEPCNLSPPDYNSIATPSASAVRASQQSRNNEKQALRDAWREQADQLAQARHVQVPRITGSRSIEPSSNSNSNSGSSGENRVRLGISGADLSPTTSILSDQQRQVGRRGYLPEGMDVREALAKCEDPTLGWSLQFWVTIADPVVGLLVTSASFCLVMLIPL